MRAIEVRRMAYDSENKMEEFEEERKEIWILLAAIMGLTIAVAGLLDLLVRARVLNLKLKFQELESVENRL